MSNPEIPRGWRQTTIGAETDERKERVGSYSDPPIVLSSTKHYGLVPSDEFFRSRTVYSNDLANYKRVSRCWLSYATNHLAEGSIGLQDKFDHACVSPIYTVFSCRGALDPRYLYRILKSPKLISMYRIHEQASVDRRGAVRYRDFAKIQLTLPPLAEQQEIIAALAVADESISSAERLIAKLERAKEGIFNDLITMGVYQSRNTRSADLILTPLGLRPRDWRVVRVKELLKSRPRNGYSPPEVDYWTGTLMLGLGCLTPTGFRPIQLKNAPRNDAALNKAMLTEGDILISRANTREHVGFVGSFQDIGVPCTYPDLMMKLEPNHRVLPGYLEILLRAPSTRRQIQAAASGTSGSMVKISSNVVRDLIVAMPGKGEQQETIEILSDAEDRINCERQKLAKLRLVRQGLMDDLLTGQVRVGAAT